MNTTAYGGPETETTGNNPVYITRPFWDFAVTRVMRRGTDPHTGSPAHVRKSLDSGQIKSKLELEHRSSAACSGEEDTGKDSFQSAPGDVPLSVVGRAKEHGPGEENIVEDMNDNAPSKVATSQRRYPSVFALSIVFGGGIGQLAFSVLGLPPASGFLVGFAVVFLALASAVLTSRARSES